MATRSLTEVFILMRNNALQNRHLFSEQVSSSLLVAVSVAESPASVSQSKPARVLYMSMSLLVPVY